MKKILTAILAVLLLLTLSVSVFADDAAETPSYSEEYQAFLYDDWGDAINNQLQKDSFGTAFAIALKPADEIDAENTWFDFEINIPGDCKKLNIVFNCAAKGDNRWMDVTFNGQTYNINCENTSDWGVFFANTLTIENVTKGDYVLRVACPANFDNDTIKTPNIDLITLDMFFEDYETVPETDAVTTAAPETDEDTTADPADDGTTAAPADDNTTAAPAEEESGCGSALASVAIVLIATLGCAVIKRK